MNTPAAPGGARRVARRLAIAAGILAGLYLAGFILAHLG